MSAKKDKADKADAASTNGKPTDAQGKQECFVIMPISDPDGYEQGHFGQVFDDLFVPACERAGYEAIRADQVRQTNLIHLDVLQKILESPMALCDLSNRNPNVMFELGLRQAFDKPVVLVQEIGTPAIFDTMPLRYTEYHREMFYRHVIEDQEKITRAIIATTEALRDSKSVNSIVKLLSITHPASLTNIAEGDKESAMMQVVLAELSNLRSEIREAAGQSRIYQPSTSYKTGSVKSRSELHTAISDLGLSIKLLEDEFQRLRREGVSSDVVRRDILWLVDEAARIKDEARTYADDNALEHITLLETQIKVLNNRQRKHSQMLSQNNQGKQQ